MQALLDQHAVAVQPQRDDLSVLQPAFLVDDHHAVAPPQRIARQVHDVVRLHALDVGIHEQSHGKGQRGAGVRHPRDDVHHPALHVDLRFRTHQLSVPDHRLSAVVGAQRHPCLQFLGQGAPVPKRQVQEREFAVGDGQPDFHDVGGVDRGDRGAPRHELPEVHLLRSHETRERGADLAASEVARGLFVRHPRVLQRRRGDAVGAQAVLDLRAAGELAVPEAANALEFEAGVLMFRLRTGEAGPGPGDRGGEVLVVEAQERVTGLEVAPGHQGRGHPHHASGNLGNELALGTRAHRALGAHREPDRGDFHRRYAHRERYRLGGVRLETRCGRHEGEGGEHRHHHDDGWNDDGLGHLANASRRTGCPARATACRMVWRLRSMIESRLSRSRARSRLRSASSNSAMPAT